MKTSKEARMIELSIRSFAGALLGALCFAAPVTAQGLVETYLSSFKDKYSVEFVEESYCSGILYDTGVSFGQYGLETGDKELVEFSQALLDKQAEMSSEIAGYYFDEINPAYAGKTVDEISDDEWQAGIDKAIAAMGEVNSSDRYEFVFDYISYFEWLGLYAYCSEVYLPDGGILSADLSVEALLGTENGTEGFFKQGVEYTIEAGQVVIDWAQTQYHSVSSLNVCEGDLDLVGGAALGTAATSVLAGESVLVVIGSSTVLTVSAPAVATGVTISSLAGATLFLTAKGYCYVTT